MSDDENFPTTSAATGILHCLRMLAEEAATLRLTRTQAALLEAIEICAAERADPRLELEESMTHAYRVLH